MARPFSTITHTPHSIFPQPRQQERTRLVSPADGAGALVSANAVPATGAAIVLATAVAAASFANARRVTDSLLMHPPLLFRHSKSPALLSALQGRRSGSIVAWPPIVPSTLTLARAKGRENRARGAIWQYHAISTMPSNRGFMSENKKEHPGPVFAGGSVYNSGTEEVRGISEGMCVPALRRLVTFRGRRPSKRSHRCSEL